MDRYVSFPRSGWVGLATLIMATVAGFALLATPAPVAATLCQPNVSVTTLVDGDPGSLRSAIAQVCTGGTITFAVNGTIHFATGSSALAIDRDMNIVGPGPDHLTIDGGSGVQIFLIGGANVNLSGMTLQNGSGSNGGAMLVVSGSVAISDTVIMSSTASSGGGGILNLGTLTLTNVSLSGNHQTGAMGGGGLYNGGTAALDHVQFFNNSDAGYGGGIMNPGALSMNNVVLQENSSPYGGGLFSQGTVTASNLSVRSNMAGFSGGGLWNETGSLELTNSAVISNSANSGNGQGIENTSGAMTLTNVTLSGNLSMATTAPVRAPTPLNIQRGGGIDTSGTVALTNVTIANNAATEGGGIYVWWGDVVLTNTLLANNNGGNCGGTITSGGHNLDTADTCLFRATGDLTTTNPFLGPLADNGGPTLTHALPRGSPAIDHGTNLGCPATDQRGKSRPFDGDYNSSALCDIGAFEYNVPMLFVPLVFK